MVFDSGFPSNIARQKYFLTLLIEYLITDGTQTLSLQGPLKMILSSCGPLKMISPSHGPLKMIPPSLGPLKMIPPSHDPITMTLLSHDPDASLILFRINLWLFQILGVLTNCTFSRLCSVFFLLPSTSPWQCLFPDFL